MPAVAVKRKSAVFGGSNNNNNNNNEKENEDEKVFLERSLEFQQEGDQFMQKKEFKNALQFYEQAKQLMPKGHELSSGLDASRAECYLVMDRLADAVSAASDALKMNGENARALVTRAKAYASTENETRAKKDIARAHELLPEDSHIKHMHDLILGVGNGKTPAGLGGMNLAPSSKKKGGKMSAAEQQLELQRKQRLEMEQRQKMQEHLRQNPSQAPMIHLKAKLGDDTRVCVLSSAIAYRDLVTTMTNKFPDAGQFTIKYTDEKGDLRPLQTREDFQIAIHWTSVRLSKAETPSLAPPCVKLTLVELAKIEDMAILGEDGKPVGLPPNEVVEIDEWILDFAALFREHLGIDAEAHLDFHSDGLDKCSEALEPTKSLEESNGPDGILSEASKKFQEAAAMATFNWGNVHMCSARKKMDGGREPPAEEGGNPGAAIATAANFDEVEKELAIAASRFEAALEIKPDFVDAATALAQRRYERARLLCAAAGLSGPDSTRKPEKGHDAKKRTAEAEQEFSQAVDEYRAALKQLPDEPPKTPKTAEELEAHEQAVKEAQEKGEDPPVLDEPTMRAQVLVMLGNTLFEQSQMRARVGKEWKSVLEEAVGHFKYAGCNQTDIDAALKVHKGNLMEAAAAK
jgi:tetratricopeptide (TPR) repeat protein|tara:strand:+ start:822 stop:2720 length:1899 start_codon:yes stop_codon:yes gene_type:complete